MLARNSRQIFSHHLTDERSEVRFVAPAQSLMGLRRIAAEIVCFRRTEVARINLYEHAATVLCDSALLEPRSLPTDRDPDLAERPLDEIANRVTLAGGEHVVVGLILL